MRGNTGWYSCHNCRRLRITAEFGRFSEDVGALGYVAKVTNTVGDVSLSGRVDVRIDGAGIDCKDELLFCCRDNSSERIRKPFIRVVYVLKSHHRDDVLADFVNSAGSEGSKVGVDPVLRVSVGTGHLEVKEVIGGVRVDSVAATVLLVDLSHVIVLVFEFLRLRGAHNSLDLHVEEWIVSNVGGGGTVARVVNDRD